MQKQVGYNSNLYLIVYNCRVSCGQTFEYGALRGMQDCDPIFTYSIHAPGEIENKAAKNENRKWGGKEKNNSSQSYNRLMGALKKEIWSTERLKWKIIII